MNAIFYLFLANLAIWCGFCGYLIFLGLRMRSLKRRLENLEMDDHDNCQQ